MWYTIDNINELDSPALVVYSDRVRENIRRLVDSVNDPLRVRPHIKTHKSDKVAAMMLEEGIQKFKCATISEAEMLAQVGANDILLAYQPVGPKAERLARLMKKFPTVKWSCLIDNVESAQHLSGVMRVQGFKVPVYVDLNVGMNRTGIEPHRANELVKECSSLSGIQITGLHAYDGHLRDADFGERERKCHAAFKEVETLRHNVEEQLGRKVTVVAGGSPTFSIHRKRPDVECSPGTFIYWDAGYESILKEQSWHHAALVISRVISRPGPNLVCTDLGHKAIASENPLPKRVYFLNAPDLVPVSHSEEHMVFQTSSPLKVGDVLYGVPWHICPTVALHEHAHAVIDGLVVQTWEIPARKRKLTV